MNRWVTLLLAGFLAVLAAVIVFAPGGGGPGVYQSGRSYLLRFEAGGIDWLEIRRGQERLRLMRGPDGWRLEEPVQDRANAAAVERILDAAQLQEVVDSLSSADVEAIGAAELGLVEPGLSLKFGGAGRSWQLDFGREGAAEGLVYVRQVPGRAVYLVRDELAGLLRQPVEALRDLRLAGLPASRVERVRIVRPDGEIELSRERGAWHLVRPLRALAREEWVEKQLELLLGARVLRFLPMAGMPPNVTRLEVWAEGADEPLEMLCTVPAPEELAKDHAQPAAAVWSAKRGAVMLVPLENTELLKAGPAELRDPALLRPVVELVDRIRILEPQGQVELARAPEGDWSMQWNGNERFAVSDQTMTRFFGLLASPVGEFLLPNPSRPLPAEPDVVIELASWLSENTAEEQAGRHLLHRITMWKGQAGLVRMVGAGDVATDKGGSLAGQQARGEAPDGGETKPGADAKENCQPDSGDAVVAVVDEDPSLRVLEPGFLKKLHEWMEEAGGKNENAAPADWERR